jgi:hypothetical protein
MRSLRCFSVTRLQVQYNTQKQSTPPKCLSRSMRNAQNIVTLAGMESMCAVAENRRLR